MKITDVRPWIVTGPGDRPGLPGHAGERLHYVFVQVDTDEGLTGWGEITTYPAWSRIAPSRRCCARCAGPHRPGPARIEAIWHKLFRLFTYMGTRGRRRR
jgi:galactonate dehydratase